MALIPTSQIMTKLRQGQTRGLERAAELVGEASDRNAPKDTRDLVESRRIKVEGRRAAIRYGDGLEDPRAVINHEKSEIKHRTGGPKYLERALASELPKVRQAISTEVEKKLR